MLANHTAIDLLINTADKWEKIPLNGPIPEVIGKKIVGSRALALPIVISELFAVTIGSGWVILFNGTGVLLRGATRGELLIVPESEYLQRQLETFPKGKDLLFSVKKVAGYAFGGLSTVTTGWISPKLNGRIHHIISKATQR